MTKSDSGGMPMKYMRYLSAIVAAAAALVLAPSASAEVPMISVTNTGGVPKLGTSKCEFTLQFEKCQLTVSNGSLFSVVVKTVEIAGTNGSTRYGIINPQCKKGSKIPSGKSCTDEVILNAFAVAGWSNWYFIEVEDVWDPKNVVAANASLITI